MRTSRLSRDTSRILAATSAQRSLRRNRSTSNSKVSGTQGGTSEEGGSTERDKNDASDSRPEGGAEMSSRKRKRGYELPATVKHEEEEISISAITSPIKTSKPRKGRRMPSKKTKGLDGSVKVEPPANWEEMYSLTRQMRNENIAPVDTMGCESLADRERSPRDQRFQTLIALMLSSQTKDTVTSVAMRGMQKNMPGGFNLESVLALEPSELNAFICKVGFHNLKTKYIKQTAEILRDKWKSDIPDSIEGLTSLPGVGPKMAYLTMSAAWGRDLGIGVDVHVHRITNLWGWHKTQQPEQTRELLEAWLPQDKWHDINNLLVGLGQTICLPVGRKCGDCKLADRGLCPSAVVAKSIKVKKETVTIKAEASAGVHVTKGKRTVAHIDEVKAEDVETGFPDMEDIGIPTRGRSGRNVSSK